MPCSGFTCGGFSECSQYATPTPRPAWYLWQGDLGLEGIVTTTTFANENVLVKPILVAHRPTDQAVLASATQAAQAGRQSTQSEPQLTGQTDSATDRALGEKHSLSGGAIAGIAIAALCVGAILAAVGTFLLLRLCFGYRVLPRKVTSEEKRQVDAAREQRVQFKHQPLRGATPLSELSTYNVSVNSRAELRG